MSSNYLGIIRMEREGVEKARVVGLVSGVQGIRIWAGKRKILRKPDAGRRWRKSQKPRPPRPRTGHPRRSEIKTLPTSDSENWMKYAQAGSKKWEHLRPCLATHTTPDGCASIKNEEEAIAIPSSFRFT